MQNNQQHRIANSGKVWEQVAESRINYGGVKEAQFCENDKTRAHAAQLMADIFMTETNGL